MDPEELGRKVLLGEIKSPGGYGSTNGLYNMKLNPEHINIAQEIDRKFTKLEGKGYDYAKIFVEMSDLMPKFKKLLDELDQNGIDQLSIQFSGFYQFSKFLEWISAQIASGEIKVP